MKKIILVIVLIIAAIGSLTIGIAIARITSHKTIPAPADEIFTFSIPAIGEEGQIETYTVS